MQTRWNQVRLEALAYDLPERRVSSLEIEERLAPAYDALRMHPGRLELMSGIAERRFYEPGTRPSAISMAAAEKALEKSGVNRERLGTLIHSAVCRDFMEPATASVIHDGLKLPASCVAFDLSNACLGFMNSIVMIAGQIERREIEAGLVVSGEDGGPLVEATIEALLQKAADGTVTRRDVKAAYASLTIGAGGAAAVLCHEDIAQDSSRQLIGAAGLAATEHNQLCQGDRTKGASGPLMETDSEALMIAGNALAAQTWKLFLKTLDVQTHEIERIVTHQVGSAHRKLLLETLGLGTERDFPTVETLGNIGSVSVPLSLARAIETGFVEPGARTGLLGIGSGLQCLMVGLE